MSHAERKAFKVTITPPSSSRKIAKKGFRKQHQRQQQQQQHEQQEPTKVMTKDLLQDCLYVFLTSCDLIGGSYQGLLEQPGRLLNWMEAANMEQVNASLLLHTLATRVAATAGSERKQEVFNEVWLASNLPRCRLPAVCSLLSQAAACRDAQVALQHGAPASRLHQATPIPGGHLTAGTFSQQAATCIVAVSSVQSARRQYCVHSSFAKAVLALPHSVSCTLPIDCPPASSLSCAACWCEVQWHPRAMQYMCISIAGAAYSTHE
jgi:hypothetical protein